VSERQCETCFLSSKGADHVELIPGGGDIELNSSNIHDYVRKYAEYRMIKVVAKPLEVITHFCVEILIIHLFVVTSELNNMRTNRQCGQA